MTNNIPIISFYSVTGGTGRSTLTLASAILLKYKYKKEPVIIDFDFEAPTQIFYTPNNWEDLITDKLVKYFKGEFIDPFTQLLWRIIPRDKIFEIDFGDGKIPVITTFPSISTVERVIGAWGIPIKSRIDYMISMRKYALKLNEVLGSDIVIVDARSGLVTPSQDLLIASDTIVLVTPATIANILRTIFSLAEIFYIANVSDIELRFRKALRIHKDITEPKYKVDDYRKWIVVWTYPWHLTGSGDIYSWTSTVISNIFDELRRSESTLPPAISKYLIYAGAILKTSPQIYISTVKDLPYKQPYELPKIFHACIKNKHLNNCKNINEYLLSIEHLIKHLIEFLKR